MEKAMSDAIAAPDRSEFHQVAMTLFRRAYQKWDDRPTELYELLNELSCCGTIDLQGDVFTDFLAYMIGEERPVTGVAYTALVALLFENMRQYGAKDTDISGEGPVYVKLDGIGEVNDDFRRQYAALEEAVVADARALIEAKKLKAAK